MRRRSRAGGKSLDPQRRKTGARKSHITPKAVHPRGSSTTREETKVARLTRERDEGLQRQTATADENARLLNELRQRTTDLTESLDQQTATSEVLGVISRSSGELHSVFEIILQNAVRICGAKFGNLWLREGDFVRIRATHGAPAEWSEFLRREPVFRLDPRLGTARLIITKQPYQVADIAAEPTYGDKVRIATIELAHARSFIGVPCSETTR
jgi:two-component system NtrC family sensor kinase